jgi:hypothetical protein
MVEQLWHARWAIVVSFVADGHGGFDQHCPAALQASEGMCKLAHAHESGTACDQFDDGHLHMLGAINTAAAAGPGLQPLRWGDVCFLSGSVLVHIVVGCHQQPLTPAPVLGRPRGQ